MKKLWVFVLAMSALGTVSGQEQKQVTYKLTGNVPHAFELYGDVAYYKSGDKIYNLQGMEMLKREKIVDFKVSPDGKSYAVMTEKKGKRKITFYDLWRPYKVLIKAKKLSVRPTCMAYDETGSVLLVAGGSTLYHINSAKGTVVDLTAWRDSKPFSKIATGKSGCNAMAFANKLRVSKTSNRSVSDDELSANVRHIEFSKDGSRLAVLTEDGNLKIYNVDKEGQLKGSRSCKSLGDVTMCSFHPDGTYIAVCTANGDIMVLNTDNPDKREVVQTPEKGATFVRFAQNSQQNETWLAYNTASQLVYVNMNHLEPLRSQVVADKVQERMDEWELRQEGESLDAYRLRVNDDTREQQMKRFEREVMADMAMAEYGMAEMQMGSYNTETGMMAMSIGEQFDDLYLEVPQEELPAFLEPDNVEFRNMQYALNNDDEFKLVYADVFNKATGKTYSYDNTQGQFSQQTANMDAFTPIEIVNQTMVEENTLSGLREDVMAQAKQERLISDHTQIAVNTQIRPSVSADGRNVRNYEVGVTYTVEKEFSAKEDYSGGRYLIEQSNAGVAMLNIVKQALEKDFAKYVVKGKHLKVKISGAADATPIRKTIAYNGSYGDFNAQPIYIGETPTTITVTRAGGISTNEQLAFLRAVGVKEYLMREASALREMDTEVEYHISVSKEEGSEHRKVSVELIFEDAFSK